MGANDLWVGGIARRQPVRMCSVKGRSAWLGGSAPTVLAPEGAARPLDRGRRRPVLVRDRPCVLPLCSLLAGRAWPSLRAAPSCGLARRGALRAGAFWRPAGAFLAAAGAADLPAAATAASLSGTHLRQLRCRGRGQTAS